MSEEAYVYFPGIPFIKLCMMKKPHMQFCLALNYPNGLYDMDPFVSIYSLV